MKNHRSPLQTRAHSSEAFHEQFIVPLNPAGTAGIGAGESAPLSGRLAPLFEKKSRFAWSRVGFSAASALGCAFAMLAPMKAHAQSTTWNGGTGDWFTAGNWSAGVPTSGINPIISAGTAQIGNPGAVGFFLEVGGSNSGALSISSTGTLTIGRAAIGISGGGSVTVGGEGANMTSLSSIVLGLNAGGNGTLTIQNGGTVTIAPNGGNGLILSNVAGSTGTLNLNPGGTLQIGGSGGLVNGGGTSNFNFNGTIQVIGADLSTSVNASLGNSATVDTNGFNATLSGTLTYQGEVDSGGVLTKIGAGTLFVTGSNSYSGGTNINGGTLSINNGSALGTGDINLGGGELLASTTLQLNNPNFNWNAGTSTVSAAHGATLTLEPETFNVADGATMLFGSAGNDGTVVLGDQATNINGQFSLTVVAGTLTQDQFSDNNVLGFLTSNATATTINAGAALNFADSDSEIANLQGAGQLITGQFPGTNITIDQGNFSGVISGPGQILKLTSGTLTLSGANTYTGGTAIGGGVLQIFNDNNLGDPSGSVFLYNNATLRILADVTSNRALILDAPLKRVVEEFVNLSEVEGPVGGGTIDTNGFNLTWNGIISGSGALTKAGFGVLTLTGANTYQGGTTVTGGLINFANAGNFGPANITLNGGGLQWATGNSTDISSKLNPFGSGGATFDTNGNNVTLATPLTGAGGLTKQGAGALTLPAVNTYSGDTTVSGGSLFVDGSIASTNTFITSGGLIGGHGTINGNLINGGVVSPGNSPGTLSVGGNYTQSSAGGLLIQIGGLSAGQFDLLQVHGSASLAGALSLQQLNNFHFGVGNKVTFLTAGGGVSGTFNTVTGNFNDPPFIGLEIIYGSNTVSVEGVQDSFVISGETPNQKAAAVALDLIAGDPRFAKLISRLDSESVDKVLQDLDRLGPAELTAIFQIAISQDKIQTANIERRLEDLRLGVNGFSSSGFAMNGSNPGYAGPMGFSGAQGPDGKGGKDGKMDVTPPPDPKFGFFITGDGQFTSVGGTDNARGYDLTSAGVTLGLDYKLTPHLAIGLALGYNHDDADLTRGGRVTVDGGKLMLYGTYFTGGFYTNVAVQGGYNNYDSQRSAVEGTARSSTDGGELNVLFGTGYDWKIGALTFGPTANFEYSYVGLNGATERGSLAPLTLAGQSQESVRSTFGAKVSYDWKLGGVTIIPELRVGWQHEYGDSTFQFGSRFDGAGSDFTVAGPATGRDSLLVGAGFAVRWSDRFSTYVYYDGELGRTNYESNTVSGGFRWEF